MLTKPTTPARCVAALALALCAGCGATTFEHGEPSPLGSVGGDSFGVVVSSTPSDGGFPGGQGNYPDPAVTRCGGVADQAAPIEGLSSAWAVVAIPGATADGLPVANGSIRLRISEHALLECGDPLVPYVWSGGSGSSGTTGTSGGRVLEESDMRGLELTFAPDELDIGVHQIATLNAAGFVALGAGVVRETAAGGHVELLRVDDDCVVGVVRGLVTEDGLPFMGGGFVAQTCQRQCHTVDGRPC